MGSFRASVQYGDCEGTAAADRADRESLGDHLRQQGLVGADEFLVAMELYVGENHDGHVQPPSIRALVVRGTGFDHALDGPLKMNPVPVRTIDVPMSIEQLLGFFKRFSVTLTVRGADLEGREYREIG